MFRFFAADDAGVAFLVLQHDARRGGGVVLDFILAFATAAPARFYKVFVFHAREKLFEIVCKSGLVRLSRMRG